MCKQESTTQKLWRINVLLQGDKKLNRSHRSSLMWAQSAMVRDMTSNAGEDQWFFVLRSWKAGLFFVSHVDIIKVFRKHLHLLVRRWGRTYFFKHGENLSCLPFQGSRNRWLSTTSAEGLLFGPLALFLWQNILQSWWKSYSCYCTGYLTNFVVFILYFLKLEQFCVVIIACYMSESAWKSLKSRTQ